MTQFNATNLLFLLLAVGMSQPAWAAPPAAAEQAVRGVAPTLKVTHVGGPTVDLRARDVPVLVEVWATWCGPCLAAFPELSKLQKDHVGRLHVVGLSDEDPIRVRRFFDHHRRDMAYTVVADPTSQATQSLMLGDFGASGLPSAYLLHRGQVIWAGQVGDFPPALVAGPAQP